MKGPRESIAEFSGIDQCPPGHDVYMLYIADPDVADGIARVGVHVPRGIDDLGDRIRATVFSNHEHATDYSFRKIDRKTFNRERFEAGIDALTHTALDMFVMRAEANENSAYRSVIGSRAAVTNMYASGIIG